MRAGMPPSRAAGLLLAVTPVVITLLATFTDLDLQLADAAFDARLGDFPWRHAWLAEVFSHVLLKQALVGLAAVFIALALCPHPRLAAQRRQLRVVAGCALLVPGLIALLKQLSSSHCPWDLARYGGSAPYVRLLEALPAGVAPGHCMPAGHASSALWMVSLAVLFLPARPRTAAAVFGAMLTFGVAVGWLQQLRGAHFLSHTLWSAWIACSVLYALLHVHAPSTTRLRPSRLAR